MDTSYETEWEADIENFGKVIKSDRFFGRRTEFERHASFHVFGKSAEFMIKFTVTPDFKIDVTFTRVVRAEEQPLCFQGKVYLWNYTRGCWAWDAPAVIKAVKFRGDCSRVKKVAEGIDIADVLPKPIYPGELPKRVGFKFDLKFLPYESEDTEARMEGYGTPDLRRDIAALR